ncbi:putative kinesin [Tricladium varicosporioides]|nr:putative kinesin [Hymenoscyphus varicosporioides]
MANPPRIYEDYQIGVICALPVEMAAMVAMLDETHPKLAKLASDHNDYTLGRIGAHNIVIACLPAGLMGNGPAAIVANSMQRSFPIKFGLMVGVGGGVWSKKDDIRLGDIVVSQPTGVHGGVVQWDFGKMGQGGEFQRTGSLNKPPLILLNALQELRTFDITDGVDIQACLSIMVQNKPRMGQTYQYPGADRDQLFKATYEHERDETCETCDTKSILQRLPRENSSPKIHYGNIASGSEVMKHGVTRDRIANDLGVICFEMEAAGLMDNFRCIVIRGICDYADSHKNKIWQPYAAATAAAFARVLLRFIDEQEVINMSSTPKPPKPFRVLPFGRNKDFVGRQSHLDHLIKILYTEDTQEDCQRVALVGLGGVGKTQIALECAFQLQKLIPNLSVLWVRASGPTSFDTAYRDIGHRLKIPGIEDDKADVKTLVQTRLSQETAGKWLMIIDNADDYDIFHHCGDDASVSKRLWEYLPSSELGAILFTTRDREAATSYAGSNVIDILEMSNEESRDLLFRNLQNKPLIDDDSSTTKLLELLVNFPLAIIQAAAYINAKDSSIAEYLRIYQESNENTIALLSKDFKGARRYPDVKNPVATTWLISFEQIQKRDHLAAKYLAFISCIKEQNIPRDLLPPASEIEKTEALGTLKAFGFIKERVTRDSYDMHPLVYKAMQNWLKIMRYWEDSNREGLINISKIFPQPQHTNRAVWTRYLPHAQYIITSLDLELIRTKETSEVKEHLWRLLCNLGYCFSIKGQYIRAEGMFRQALQLQETVLKKGHPSILINMNNLAASFCDQGKYIEAEIMERQILHLQEMVFGKDCPDTLLSMNSLAIVLSRQGKYVEAEAISRQALQLQERVLGKDHPDTLSSMSNLAIDLSSQGKYIEAEVMHRQALQLQEKVLGKDHPDTLLSMNSLSIDLSSQGNYAEAEAISRRALQLQERVLGKDHPDTLLSMNNLAIDLSSQGKYVEAESMSRQAVQLQEVVLGKDHPDTLLSMNNLAIVLSSQGKYAEAEAISQQAVQLQEMALGKNHPYTLSGMSNLAMVLNSRGKYAEAEIMSRQALQSQEMVLGKDHPDTRRSIIYLVECLSLQGKHEEIETIYQKVGINSSSEHHHIRTPRQKRKANYSEISASLRKSARVQERLTNSKRLQD